MKPTTIAGGRPPDPEKDAAAGAGTRAADNSNFDNEQPQHSTSGGPAQGVSYTLLLAHLMPRTAAALLANSATLSGFAQVLPVTAAAVSGALR